MFTQLDVNMVASQISTTAIPTIATKAGVSKPTVYRFFQGKKIRPDNEQRIYTAALNIIERDQARAQRLKAKHNKILKAQTE